ncbi:MAG: ATPase [Ilumatobacteraceae bacterium]|nr:ATPase [Ilumatobacteraceae bacterium]
MSEKLQLELSVLLPDALDGRDGCVHRLTETLDGAPGIEDVHLVDASGGGPAQLCLHYDPATTSVARIRARAEAAGAELTERYAHVLWPVTGVGHIRKARSVGESLSRIDGVMEADVAPGLVRVEFDRTELDEDGLRQALLARKVSVTGGPGPPEHDEHDEHDGHEGHDREGGQHDHGGPFGERSEIVFAMTSASLWVIGLILDLTGSAEGAPVTAVFIAAALLGGYFTSREAIDSVRNGRFEIDFLMLFAAAGAAVLGKWEEGALLLALFSLGHALEGYAMGRARRAIEALAELAPPTAVVRDATGEREVPVEELAVGDTVVVKPNERIPADGFVLSGTSSVDQAPLTGESIPVDKVPVVDREAALAAPDQVAATSRLFSGTINGAGQLDLVVTRPAADSTLAKLASLVREAETQASPTQRFTDRFERAFVPAVLVLVVVVLVIGGLLGDWSEAFYRAMAVLVAASPCALAIATPSAVLAAVARAGQLGVLVKGGGPLENLGTLRAIAFDKTGTLTEGRPQLTDVVASVGSTEADLLAVAVAVERRSDHPLASAITRDGAARLGAAGALEASGVTAVTGRGVRARIGGDEVRIGNAALFDDVGGVPSETAEVVAALQAEGRTIMIVQRSTQFLGVMGLMDAPRADARLAIEALEAVGIRRAVMLSGDHQLVAEAIGRQVGVTDVWGDLMPEDKVTAIERLRTEEGKVAMVGDGVNDAPALAHATVGIAMGAAGSDVALETADIALMGDDLSKLPVVIGLSRKASRIIRQNLYLSLAMVAFLIPATLLGYLGIGPAVILHEGSTLVVVVNALRLLGYRAELRPPAQEAGAARRHEVTIPDP